MSDALGFAVIIIIFVFFLFSLFAKGKEVNAPCEHFSNWPVKDVPARCSEFYFGEDK